MHCTLRQLSVFEAVARHLSYTRAAEELHLSQPAVSMQVKQLEANLGLPLLELLGKRLYLTEAGEEFHRYCRNISQQLLEAEQVLEELKGPDRGRLRLAVASTVNYFVTRLLGRYRAAYPQVRVCLEVTNREQLLRLLLGNAVDLVIMGTPPEDAELSARPFMENPLVLIAPPGHRLEDRSGVPPKELAGETFLLRETGSGTRHAMERHFRKQDIPLEAGMEMNTNEAIKQGVEAGLGLGLVSLHTVGPELRDGRLRVLDIQGFPLRRQWYAVHRRGKRLSAVAREFQGYLLDNAAAVVADPA